MDRTDKLRPYRSHSQERALRRRFGCSRWVRNCGHEPRLDGSRRRRLTLKSVKLFRITTRTEPARSSLTEALWSCNTSAGRSRLATHLSGTPAQPPLSHRVPLSDRVSGRVIRGPRP